MNDTPATPDNSALNQPVIVRSVTSEKRFTTLELAERLDGFGDIRLHLRAMLGTVHMPIEQFLKLTRGSVITLNRHKAEPIDLVVNGLPVAKVDITVINEHIGVEVINVQKPSIIEPII